MGTEHMALIAVVLLALPSPLTCNSARWSCSHLVMVPDMDLMKRGYHIVEGDPSAENDPGFKENVFNILSNTINPVAYCYGIPSEYQADNYAQTCNIDSQTVSMSTSSSFQRAMSFHVTADGEWGAENVKFTGSVGYKRLRSEIVQKGHTWVWRTTKCSVFSMQLRSSSSVHLTSEFKWAVRNLSDNIYNEEKLKAFVDKFGTHYPVRMTIGARFRYESLFEYCTWLEMNKTSFNIERGAEASFRRALGLPGSNIYPSSLHDTWYADQYDGYRASWRRVNLGQTPSRHEHAEDWLAESWSHMVGNGSRAIGFTLRPLTDLMTTENFGSIDDITSVKNRLNQYLERVYASREPEDVTYDCTAAYAQCSGGSVVQRMLQLLRSLDFM